MLSDLFTRLVRSLSNKTNALHMTYWFNFLNSSVVSSRLDEDETLHMRLSEIAINQTADFQISETDFRTVFS